MKSAWNTLSAKKYGNPDQPKPQNQNWPGKPMPLASDQHPSAPMNAEKCKNLYKPEPSHHGWPSRRMPLALEQHLPSAMNR